LDIGGDVTSGADTAAADRRNVYSPRRRLRGVHGAAAARRGISSGRQHQYHRNCGNSDATRLESF